MSVAAAADGLSDVYQALEAYSWDDDVEFQSGLSAILGSNSTPAQAEELALRARCFYYARSVATPAVEININIDFDAYKAYRNSRRRPPALNGVQPAAVSASAEPAGSILPAASSNPSEPPAPYPTSFAHIVELVTTGQPIPGIKEIPTTVLTGQGSEAAKSRRRKPWETDDSAVRLAGVGQDTTA